MALAPGSRLGPYSVVTQIGVGGMGEVYRATDANLKRAVALKVLPESVAGDAERLARFQREAEVLATLNHPNIAAIYGLERGAGTTALVMELVEGPTLADRIAEGPIPPAEAAGIAGQIAEALDAAHGQGIVHRDLKPANIKVRSDDTVKVLDFGLARVSDPARSSGQALSGSGPSMPATMTSPAMTQVGMLLGTAAYMAPEQARGRPVDRRADVWAFGAVLYEMLTGTRAFPGDDVSDVMASVLAREPDWSRLPASAPALAQCVRRCLQRDPRQRFGDMQSVRLALEGAFTPSSEAAAVASPPPRRSPVLPWVAAGVATLAAVAMGAAWLTRPAPERPVVRTMIPPPEGTVFDFDVTVGPAVISPDGTQIAFSARTPEGRIDVWVRPLDSTAARRVEGTQGGSFPFWSPDSRSLGFYSSVRGRLERVEVAGGAPVVIASAGFVRAAHWAPGGTIVYTTSDRGARLMAVSLSGGAPTPLATVSTLPRAPRLLPDGQHLLYFDRTARQIRVASRDGRSDEVVTDATSGAIYVDGRLLFLRENALLAQPFDLSRRVLTGTAQAVARDVQSLLGESTGIFSASETGLLLYQDGAAESATSLAWFDRDGKRQATVRETGSARGLFLSPDDRVAAMGTTDPQGRTDLWAVDLPTGAIRRLTFDTESGDVSTFVAWASDRLSIAYATRKGDQSTVVRHPVTGGAAEPLFVVPAEDLRRWGVPRVTSWTKDGRDILYSGESTGGIWRQSITAAPGGPPANAPSALYPGNGQNPRLSPNQRWASFQASPEGVTVSGIFVDAFPGGGKRQQVADKGTLALWSDDGKFLYYAADNVLTIVEVTETDEAIRFGPPRALMPVMIGRGYSYDVASDGRILALVTSDKRASQPLTLVQHWARALDDK